MRGPLVVSLVSVLLAGCGQKGALSLPKPAPASASAPAR